MPPKRTLQFRIREWRNARGMTQTQLADAVGCSPAFISMVETGINQPSSEMLVRIAKQLTVSVEQLIAEPPPSPQNPAAHG